MAQLYENEISQYRIEIIETRTFDSKYNIIGEYLFFYYRSIISQIRIEEK